MSRPRLLVSLAALSWSFFATLAPAQQDAYAAIAASVATPLFPTHAEAVSGYKDGAVLFRMERARQTLMVLRPRESDLKAVSETLMPRLEACHSTLDGIRALDNTVPDYEGLVRKVPGALPGLAAMSGKNGQSYSQLSPQDQQAVADLAVKAAWEAGSAIVNSIRTANRWSDYRDQYQSVRKAAAGLAACAERLCDAPRPGGYGIGITIGSDGITIEAVTAGGGAARAGLRVGDKLIQVNGLGFTDTTKPGGPISGTVDTDTILRTLRSHQPGSTASVRVIRGDEARDFKVERTVRLPEASVLGIDIDGSFEGAFTNDNATFTNRSGVELTNCTLLVTLCKAAAEPGYSYVQKHLHFIDAWPAGTSLSAIYHGPDAPGIARDESLSQVQRMTIEVYSDQVRNSIDYQYYNTPDYTADVERWCKGLRFTGQFNTETAGLFSHDGFGHSDASVQIFFREGLPRIEPRKITVSVSSGSRSQTFWWSGSTWESGEWFASKTFSASEFNAFSDPSYEVRIAFPGTDYEHVLRFAQD